MSIPKRFAADFFLTAMGVGAALMAFVFSFQLSADVRGQLGRIEEEASAARVSSVLQALAQDLQHLTDYTLGYAMWDDSYAYVQAPGGAYPATNYAESVLAASPVQLVAISDSAGRLVFAAALDENGKAIAIPAEIKAPGFARRFGALRRLEDSFASVAWLGGRPYLLSAWPITNSARTAPRKGTMLFGTILGRKVLDRITALTGVKVQPMESAPPMGRNALKFRTPLPATARIDPAGESDRHPTAFAVIDSLGDPRHPVALQLELPVLISQTAQRLERVVRTDFLFVSAAFATFVVFAGGEIFRRRREGRRLKVAHAEAERLAEEAASADRAKSAFLAVMSHEIRTPLNAIIGYAELLRHAPLDAESIRSVQTIRDSGAVLLRVLNDILDFSKMEAGALAIHPEPLRIRSLFAEIHALFELQAREHNNRLRLEVDPAVPEWICTDGARLKQILSNLISNAAKFTLNGEICIRVTTDDPPRLDISVEDDGIGIPPEQESRLFQAFSQGDSTAVRRYDGAGLGLAITQRLCILMGGTIAFHRREPRGTVFLASIPYEISSPPETPVKPVPSPATGTSSARPPKILVVDDNATNARLLVAIIARHGHTARVAHSGVEALASFAEHGATLIFMDIQMPGMDGLETTRRLRTLEASLHLSPCRIIAVTADILESSHLAACASGMDDYLSKPVKSEQIRAAIEALPPVSS